MKDKPISSAENLVFHVEYIIRHKGADHLKVAALNLNRFQYLLLDILAFSICSVSVLFFTLKYCIRKLLYSIKADKNKKDWSRTLYLNNGLEKKFIFQTLLNYYKCITNSQFVNLVSSSWSLFFALSTRDKFAYSKFITKCHFHLYYIQLTSVIIAPIIAA